MKKHGYKFAWIGIVLTASLLTGGCTTNNNTTTPAAPLANEYVLQFQNGVHPDASYGGSSDTGMNAGSPAASFYGDPYFYSGSAAGSAARYFVQFNLISLLPANVNVTRAYLTVNVVGAVGTNSFAFHSLSETWDATTATWSNPWYANLGGNYSAAAKSDAIAMNEKGLYLFKLDAAMVKSWLATPSTNYGVILTATNESSGTSASGISTNSEPQLSLHPMLTVFYTLP